MSKKSIFEIKKKIIEAKSLSAFQAAKKMQAAESIIDDAVCLIEDLEHRLSEVESVLSLSNLELLINGGQHGE